MADDRPLVTIIDENTKHVTLEMRRDRYGDGGDSGVWIANDDGEGELIPWEELR